MVGAASEIIAASTRENAFSCQSWCDSDVDCQIFQYDEGTHRCTKLQSVHNVDSVFGVRMNGNSCPHGQFPQKPYMNVAGDLVLDDRVHPILFTSKENDLATCQRKASANPANRYITYNYDTGMCTSIGSNSQSTSTTGIKVFGKLNDLCGDTNPQAVPTSLVGPTASQFRSNDVIKPPPRPILKQHDRIAGSQSNEQSTSANQKLSNDQNTVVSDNNRMVRFNDQNSGRGAGYVNPPSFQLEPTDNNNANDYVKPPRTSPFTSASSKWSIYVLIVVILLLIVALWWGYSCYKNQQKNKSQSASNQTNLKNKSPEPNSMSYALDKNAFQDDHVFQWPTLL